MAAAAQLPELEGIYASLLVLVSFVSIVFLWWLQNVLVPLTIAVFVAFLVEPVLAFFVRLPRRTVWLLRRARCQNHPSRDSSETRLCAATQSPAAELKGGALDSGESSASWPAVRAKLAAAVAALPAALQQAWDVVAVVLCLVVVLGSIGGILYSIAFAFENFRWSQYEHSPKLLALLDVLRCAGVIKEQGIINAGTLFSQFQDELRSVASSVISVTTDLVLTILIFLFCLFAMLPGIHDEQSQSSVKTVVQRYLVCKTICSVIIALLVYIALLIMRVPLAVVFGSVTFVLNYIPNLGSLIAILLPVPVVYLEPNTTLLHVGLVVLVQFLVHNIAGSIIEPALMSQGMHLHPLAVIVALTFWTGIWGIPGSILSVPITCIVRIWLGGLEHPCAQGLREVLDHPLGPWPAKSRLQTPGSDADGRAAALEAGAAAGSSATAAPDDPRWRAVLSDGGGAAAPGRRASAPQMAAASWGASPAACSQPRRGGSAGPQVPPRPPAFPV